jgi:hypothetical protein
VEQLCGVCYKPSGNCSFSLGTRNVVATQIALVQFIAKLGEIEADQSSFEGRFTRAEDGIPEAPQEAGRGSQPAILTPICRAGGQ